MKTMTLDLLSIPKFSEHVHVTLFFKHYHLEALSCCLQSKILNLAATDR